MKAAWLNEIGWDFDSYGVSYLVPTILERVTTYRVGIGNASVQGILSYPVTDREVILTL